MRNIIEIISIFLLSLLSCRSNMRDPIKLYQPNSIMLDTTLEYFPKIIDYIKIINERDNEHNFLLSIYNTDDNLHLKITAACMIKEEIENNFPNYFFVYKENVIYIFSGVDKLCKFDSTYNKNIIANFTKKKICIYDPLCWEIVFNDDTCYSFVSNYPFFPIEKEGIRFRP